MADGRRLIRSVFLLGVMAICVFVIGSRAQSTEAPKPNGCPVISVTGPAGITNPGNIALFEVSVMPDTFPNLVFDWKVDGGNVDEGQATKKIGVRYTSELRGTTVTATVVIRGLPDNCPTTASESHPLTYCPTTSILLDEFSVPVSTIDTERLKIAADELEKHPNDQMYIIEYFPGRTSETSIRRKKEKIMSFMTEKLKFDGSRVTFAVAESDGGQPQTKIYRVPPGAPNPTP